MEGLAQVVGGLLHPQVGPKRGHDLLAVEVVPRSQGEQLDEVSRLPQGPGALLDGSVPPRNLETAQQPDAHSFRLSIHGATPVHATNLSYLA